MSISLERELALLLSVCDTPKPSDVIVLLEGDGFCRCDRAVSLYRHHYAPFILFSGGVVDYHYGSFPFSEVATLLKEAGVSESALLYEGVSTNTREQAVEVVKMAIDRSWEKLILVASPEHQLRAYLTFLREILDKSPDLILYNSPALGLPWCKKQDWGVRADRVEAEFDRIDRYFKQGHLASFKEAIDYQQWKEQQP